jgi:hypothetical protein
MSDILIAMRALGIKNMLILVIMSILIAACAGQSEDNAAQSTLPPPGVRIVGTSETLPVTGSEMSTPEAQPEAGVAPDIPPEKSLLKIGSESHTLDFQEFGDLYRKSGIQIVRHNGLLWQKVEPTAGDRLWNEVSDLEQKLIAASEKGLEIILIVRGTPDWAQQVPGSSCGPIKQDQLAAFASFISDAVARYSSPPYNVKYWEIGNEPDVDPTAVTANSVFGCWGNQYDEYFGGGYYAEMLKFVYPAIKAANPEVEVLLGGLLLDCDPSNPPADKNCDAGKFLEGVLRNGGGEYFDLLSFHGYTSYIGPSYDLGNELRFDDHHPSWEHLGGVVLGKVNFLRQVMAEYNVDKQIFLTEGSLICPEQNLIDCDPPGDDFYQAQANYVVRLNVRSWANNLAGSVWYQFEGPGWRYGGLLDDDQNPKPAFEAMEFLTEELSGTQFSGIVMDYENLESYEFISNEKIIWVLWSTDEIDTQIQLPGNTSVVYNKFGEDITPDSTDITVNDPIYVELEP